MHRRKREQQRRRRRIIHDQTFNVPFYPPPPLLLFLPLLPHLLLPLVSNNEPTKRGANRRTDRSNRRNCTHFPNTGISRDRMIKNSATKQEERNKTIAGREIFRFPISSNNWPINQKGWERERVVSKGRERERERERVNSIDEQTMIGDGGGGGCCGCGCGCDTLALSLRFVADRRRISKSVFPSSFPSFLSYLFIYLFTYLLIYSFIYLSLFFPCFGRARFAIAPPRASPLIGFSLSLRDSASLRNPRCRTSSKRRRKKAFGKGGTITTTTTTTTYDEVAVW